MDPAVTDDRRRRRLLIAAIAGGLALLLLVGVGVYGLLRGPAAPADSTPADRPSSTGTTSPGPATAAGPVPVPQHGGPEAFARAVAAALFAWETTSGYGPSDYAQVLADVAAAEEANALSRDVRGYLPSTEAWAQLRQYGTRQWLTIDSVVIPQAWETAVDQAAPGQIPPGALAYTISGTRHRDGIWGTEPVETARPVAFTMFIVCTPPSPDRGAGSGLCELLRLSQVDNPLR